MVLIRADLFHVVRKQSDAGVAAKPTTSTVVFARRLFVFVFKYQVSGSIPVSPLCGLLAIYLLFYAGTSSLFSFDGLLQAQFASRRDDRQVVVAVMADQVADAFEYVIFSSYLLKIKSHL